MVGHHDLDLEALRGGAEVLDGHAGGHDRAGAGEIGVGARLVVHDADLHHAVRDLRVSGAGGDDHRGHDEHESSAEHVVSSFAVV